MLKAIFGFLLGNFSVFLWKTLPSIPQQISLVLSLSLLAIILPKAFKAIPLMTAFGFFLTCHYAENILQDSLPPSWINKEVRLTGEIISPPNKEAHFQQFLFQTESICRKEICNPLSVKIRLNDYQNKQAFLPGEKWQLNAKLKYPRSYGNDGSFDYKAWAFEQGIVFMGALQASSQNHLLRPAGFHQGMNQIRYYLDRKIEELSWNKSIASFITALVVGLRSSITQAQWQVLRNTGTNHLFAISGLHVSLLAGLGLIVFKRLWRLFPIACLWLAAPRAASLFALLITWGYGAMAGFSVSTQRACLMLSVFLLGILFNKPFSGLQSFFLALFIVLFFNPLSTLSVSFWLSFVAVWVIFMALMSPSFQEKPWRVWFKIQSYLFLGLAPLTLFFFNQVSWISVVSNAIAIPWVSWCIVPLGLLSAVFIPLYEPLGKFFLHVNEISFEGLWFCLSYLAALPNIVYVSFEHSLYEWVGLFLGIGICLLPRGFPGKWCGIIIALPWFLAKAPKPPVDELWFTLLDVGQGLSVVVQTHNHVLLYDTGPRYYNGSSAGEQIIGPYLRARGIHHIDDMVVSHGDSDHSGGASYLLQSFMVAKLHTSALEKFQDFKPYPCESGEEWHWDGADFTWLYPLKVEKNTPTNHQSCVLLIHFGQKKILLPGDMEASDEAYLLTHEKASLENLFILAAPHHGSKTSSTPLFVATAKPKYALFPVGYENLFGFPDKKVILRYKEAGAMLYDTATYGSIRFVLSKNGAVKGPYLYNIEHPHLWQSKNQ